MSMDDSRRKQKRHAYTYNKNERTVRIVQGYMVTRSGRQGRHDFAHGCVAVASVAVAANNEFERTVCVLPNFHPALQCRC